MTEPMTAHRIVPVLTLLVLVPIGAFAQSDSASRPPVRAAAAADRQAGEKPGEGSRAAPSDSSYMISADDVLAINVWKEPEVSRSGPVRSDGKISLPLVGELTAGGQTPLQLEQEITKRLPARRSWQCDGRLPRGEAVEPDARIEDGPGCEVGTQRQGKEAKLSYNGNLLVESRNGLIVNTEVFEANGTAERDAALVMLNFPLVPGTSAIEQYHMSPPVGYFSLGTGTAGALRGTDGGVDCAQTCVGCCCDRRAELLDDPSLRA